MTRDWSSVFLAVGLLGLIFAAIGVTWLRDRRAAHRARVLALIERYEQSVAQCMADEARSLFPDHDTRRWPDLCADPPCDWEDNAPCAAHRVPQGRHHVVYTITDLPEPDDPWWTR